MQNRQKRPMLDWMLFVALAVLGLASVLYVGMWNVRNRHLNKAALLVEDAACVVASVADADWSWSVKTNLLSNSGKKQWSSFLKERFRPIVMERKSVEYKSFMFLKSDGATLFSIHLMKSPLVIVRINDCAYEFEGYE